MKEFRAVELTGRQLDRLDAAQEVAAITIGRRYSKCAAVLVLPLKTWGGQVAAQYSETTLEESTRVNTGSTRDKGLSDAVLLDIVLNQVGERGNLSGGTIYILTYISKDIAALVPANAYWREQLRRRGEGA